MTKVAKVFNPKSKLLIAAIAAVYGKMVQPLLVACIENGPSLLPMIKMGEEINSVIWKI